MAAKKVVKKAAKAAKAVKPSKTAKVVKAAKAAKPTKAVKPVKKAAKAAAKAKSGALKQVASALAKALKPAAKVSKPKATAKPSKPAAKAAKPAAKPAKPVAKPAKPAAKPVKPAAKPAKPAAKASKPAAKVAAKTHDKSSIKTSSPADAGGQQSNAGKQAVSKQISAVAKPPAARRTGAVGIASPPGAIKPMPVKGKIVPKYKTDTTGRPIVPEGYRPSADEEFMNPLHLEYFRTRLLQWREDLVEESKQTIENLREEVRDVGDEAERATRETENSLELRTRDRYRKLIGKIDDALKRVEDGSYGWCVDTGEEIGLERLDARLTAERTIDAQERWEHRQRQMGD